MEPGEKYLRNPTRHRLIVPGTNGFKGAAGKIPVRDRAPAGRTGVGQVYDGIAVSGVTRGVGASLNEQGRQHEQHQSFYHMAFLPGWVPAQPVFLSQDLASPGPTG